MQVLIDWKNTLHRHSLEIEKFLKTTNYLHKDYSDRYNNRTDIGFNVFTLASDYYYRENFHSDIIKAFLNPREKHKENNKYLNIFIDLLNKTSDSGNLISKSDFQNSTVEREKHNIDILISDEKSKKAIIVENKINNATDQQRQLPRYVEIAKREFDIIAIVYLTLNSSKRPDKSDWSKNELEEITQLLKIIPAFDFDKSKPNLFDNWITPSIIESHNIDSSLLLRQYGNLIKYLNTNTMDTISLEKFYNSLKENDNLKTAISIRNMLNDLPEYLAIRIEDKYKNHCYPFKNIWRNKQRDTVFEAFEKDDIYLKLDIWCDENGYTVHLWNPISPTFDMISEFKNEYEIFSEFNIHNNLSNNIKRRFDIHEEKQLFDFIDELLNVLKTLKNQ